MAVFGCCAGGDIAIAKEGGDRKMERSSGVSCVSCWSARYGAWSSISR